MNPPDTAASITTVTPVPTPTLAPTERPELGFPPFSTSPVAVWPVEPAKLAEPVEPVEPVAAAAEEVGASAARTIKPLMAPPRTVLASRTIDVVDEEATPSLSRKRSGNEIVWPGVMVETH
jgi:hypothetical protein